MRDTVGLPGQGGGREDLRFIVFVHEMLELQQWRSKMPKWLPLKHTLYVVNPCTKKLDKYGDAKEVRFTSYPPVHPASGPHEHSPSGDVQPEGLGHEDIDMRKILAIAQHMGDQFRFGRVEGAPVGAKTGGEPLLKGQGKRKILPRGESFLFQLRHLSPPNPVCRNFYPRGTF